MTAIKNGSGGGVTGGSSNLGIFSHVKYEHMIAGISGGVTSTLILHPLDLIKIRFAGIFVRDTLMGTLMFMQSLCLV